MSTSHRHDENALGVEVPTTTLGQRFERGLVADPFDQHDGTREAGAGILVNVGTCSGSKAAPGDSDMALRG